MPVFCSPKIGNSADYYLRALIEIGMRRSAGIEQKSEFMQRSGKPGANYTFDKLPALVAIKASNLT
jgi:hypothetical protein